MKIYGILLIEALIVSWAGADPADDYVNFIRQTQVDSGVEWDVTVAPSGESLSHEGVGPDGSIFELWSLHNLTASEYLLDEQYVSSYLPNAQLSITSADPYSLVPRTRVDQPFTVTVVVSGLDDGSSGTPPEDIPEAAKKVRFKHVARLYDEGSHEFPAESGNSTVIQNSFIDGNGSTGLTYSVTSLTGPDLTQVEGEEVFTISTLDDFGVSASVLDSKRIQIWPIASGSISGIDTAVRYVEIPLIQVDLLDLYPASETYVRAYLGSPVPNPTNSFLVPSSYVKITDSVPQNRDLSLTELNEAFSREGPYTLELIHVTPFGYDLLDQVYPLQVDRTIEVNIDLFTKE